MSERQSASSNELLEALPSADLASFRAHATVMELVPNRILFEAGAVLDCAYFPLDSLVSLLVVMPNGSVVEAGLVGFDASSWCSGQGVSQNCDYSVETVVEACMPKKVRN